ncbi:MAG TPA: lysophospholipid acyltransferase family protein [Bauldia sp.]|nr:lysophospholipid acyltransferase family protein [Bauldia sp.]
MIWIRSILFNVAFYLVTAVMLVGSLPVFVFGSQEAGMGVVRNWARAVLFLHEKITGARFEVRGRQYMPHGAALVASKHQSSFETIAFFPILSNMTIVMKQSIRALPLFGPYTVKTGMIHVDRDGGAAALRHLSARAREEIAKNREIVVFPEGTRRPVDAPPDYQGGVGLLYRSLNVPVVPVALNSGLSWPRRSLLHYPGTIVIEFLPPIPPGLDTRTFLTRLQDAIETASSRLVAEGRADSRR